MNFWKKLTVYCSFIMNNNYCEEIDEFLIKNFIENPKASYLKPLDEGYYIIVTNGKRYYSLWDKNRWYSWLDKCRRMSVDEKNSTEKIRYWKEDSVVWDGLRPSRKVMIRFYEWLESFPDFQKKLRLEDDEMEILTKD